MKRRALLQSLFLPSLAGPLGAAGLLGSLSLPGSAASSDYRALVVVFLNGGNDGLNSLVPTDGAYLDYQRARPDLCLAKDSLVNLSGSSGGHTYWLHPGLAPLAQMYTEQRLAWIANVGALVQPTTAQQVFDRSVALPPYLLSHSDQQSYTQGWMGDVDASGWAGRGLEAMPTSLKNAVPAVTFDNRRTLVLGRNSRVALMTAGGTQNWGPADLSNPSWIWTQNLTSMAKWQHSNKYLTEYTHTMAGSLAEATLFTQVFQRAIAPQGNFGGGNLAANLRALASVLPVFKAQGYRRQVFLVSWGDFDTHIKQRGGGEKTQDSQLPLLANALAAFDQSNQASGVGLDVTTLVMSEFGRTLRPASGGGSDHAWGNHWLAMGGAVAGGQVVGQLPSLTLSGPDDADPRGGGRFVPTTSSDQVAATLMHWLGLPDSALPDVFPNLKNFPQKTVPFLNV